MNTMKLAVFAKKRQKNEIREDGTVVARPFYSYLTTLMNKTSGEPLPVQVKFRESCGAPDPQKCPCFIEVARDKMNLSWDKYTNDEGEELQSAKLWVTEWKPAGEYVDHSMDEFDAFVG